MNAQSLQKYLDNRLDFPVECHDEPAFECTVVDILDVDKEDAIDEKFLTILNEAVRYMWEEDGYCVEKITFDHENNCINFIG